MKIIDRTAIENAANVNEWVEAMEQAIVQSLSNDILMPLRAHLDKGKDTFLIMPCIDDEYWSTKLVSFCPENSSIGLPSIYGTVVLSSSKTGEPLAVIDGTMLTAYRTAAVSAMGIKHLSNKNSMNLGIIGSGTQSLYQALFACNIRPIRNISIYDLNSKSAEKFVGDFNKLLPSVQVDIKNDPREVCLESDIIITATNSKNPVFPEEMDLFLNKTFIGIGSYKPDCREYPDSFFKHISQIWIDSLHGMTESGDLIYPIENNLIKKENVHSLGALIRNDTSLAPERSRFFKTVGSAIFDLFAAKLIYKKQRY